MSGIPPSPSRSPHSTLSEATNVESNRWNGRVGIIGLIYDDGDETARLDNLLVRRGLVVRIERDDLEREAVIGGGSSTGEPPSFDPDSPPRILRLDPQPFAGSRSKLGDLFEWRVDPRFLAIPLVRIVRRDQVLNPPWPTAEPIPPVRIRSDVDALLSQDACLARPDLLMEVLRETLRRLEQRRRDGLIARVSLEFQSDLNVLRWVAEGVLRLQSGVPLSSTQSRHLHLALLEIGGNAVEWGNRFRKECPVDLVWSWWRDRLEIAISDQGEGFDPSCLPHAAHADDPFLHLEIRQRLGLRDGGFGLMMARGLVDEFRIEQGGRRIVMIKRLDHHMTSASLSSP